MSCQPPLPAFRPGRGARRGRNNARMLSKPLPSKPQDSAQSFDVDAKHRRLEWTAPPCQLHDAIPPSITWTSDRSSQPQTDATVCRPQLGPAAAGAIVVIRDRTTGGHLLSALLLFSAALFLSAVLFFSAARGSGAFRGPD